MSHPPAYYPQFVIVPSMQRPNPISLQEQLNNYDLMKSERDNLQAQFNSIKTERDKLRMECKLIRDDYKELQAKHNSIKEERDELLLQLNLIKKKAEEREQEFAESAKSLRESLEIVEYQRDEAMKGLIKLQQSASSPAFTNVRQGLSGISDIFDNLLAFASKK